jgi:4-alpha-glucanotransferase
MRFPRSSGILLHPTSLFGPHGIGDLGAAAREFVDWLAAAGQRIWQVLPLGPTGYGDSPYQLFSAFAGNPLLIDLEELVRSGLLARSDLDAAPSFPRDTVNYAAVMAFKLPLLAKAARAFRPAAEFEDFCARQASWLDDFARFMALKKANRGAVWSRWDPSAAPDPDEIAAQKFMQFVFSRQWRSLHDYCRAREVRIMGDVPIYVAHDSADVWANPELFELDANGDPHFVAGVPPDYFSATGQLWGNPIYRWELIAKRGFDWWIERLRAELARIDILRLDHFRGFEAYWKVPAGASTAIGGEWVKGPAAAFFEAAQAALGELPLVAENLGVITPEVEAMRTRFGFPGMSVLQFAFGTDPQGPSFRPHNYPREMVAYTGTHDNDTTVGWWTGGVGDTTRSADDIRDEREFACRYLGTAGDQIHWVFIRTVLASVADIALFPFQDALGLGSEARMNLPGRPSGNWRWRCRREMLDPALAARLKELARIYDR